MPEWEEERKVERDREGGERDVERGMGRGERCRGLRRKGEDREREGGRKIYDEKGRIEG
jgi:hypothetical protein